MTPQEHKLVVHMLAKQSLMLLAILEALKVRGVMTEEEFQQYQTLLQQKPGQTQSLMNQTWMQYEIFAKMFGIEIHGNPPETPNNPKLN